MAAGLPISMIPLAPYQEASEAVRAGIYQAYSASDAHAAAQRLGIDYVVVGLEEQRAYAPAVKQLAERPDLFLPVFRNDAVTVYGVVRHQ